MNKLKIFLFSICCVIIAAVFSFLILVFTIVYCKSFLACEEKNENVKEEHDFETVLVETKQSPKEQKPIIKPTEIRQENKKENLGEFKLTAYCSCEKCCGKWALNRPKDENGKDIVYGSSGTILVAGTSIAVDPSVIPYGSQVEINGHTYTAQDTGGAIKGNRIDVYFDNHQDALNFGVKYAEVFLIVGSEKNE